MIKGSDSGLGLDIWLGVQIQGLVRIYDKVFRFSVMFRFMIKCSGNKIKFFFTKIKVDPKQILIIAIFG